MSSDDDTRIECKYGAKCYRKNVEHDEKYKHPPKRNISPDSDGSLSSKKRKINLDVEHKKNNNFDDNSSTTEESSRDEEVDTNSHGSIKMTSPVTIDANFSTTKEINKVVDTNNHGSIQITSPATIDEKKQFIKKMFQVDMPDDFYLFWELCKDLCKNKPKEAFKSVGIMLAGPYDVLEETFKATDQNNENYVLHWRYYYDPPEFQTILKGDDKSGYHMGYFRDSPDELPSFVGSNRANRDCIIHEVGENIFGALNSYLNDMLKSADPFKKITITKLHKNLISKAKELKIELNKNTSRHRRTVCKTFHTAGIVVPYNRRTKIGYRKLPVDDKELRKILDIVSLVYPDKGPEAFVPLQPVVTAATIANDECDFGSSLELGIDIFCYGNDCFNKTVSNLLKTSYALLNRHTYAHIIDLHLKNRKKGVPYVIDFT